MPDFILSAFHVLTQLILTKSYGIEIAITPVLQNVERES
jgi:hypothetical protein